MEFVDLELDSTLDSLLQDFFNFYPPIIFSLIVLPGFSFIFFTFDSIFSLLETSNDDFLLESYKFMLFFNPFKPEYIVVYINYSLPS